MKEGSYSTDDYQKVLRQLSLADVLAVKDSVYKNVSAKLLITGNLSEEQAHAFYQCVSGILETVNREKPESGGGVVKLTPSGEREVVVSKGDHSDTAVLRYYQGREDSEEERLKFLFLRRLLHQPYYDSLRTRQQIGYRVSVELSQFGETPGIAFAVQSPVAGVADIEQATDKFLAEFDSVLEGMRNEELAPLKKALFARIVSAGNRVGGGVDKFWRELVTGVSEDEVKLKKILAIKEVTIESLRQTFQDAILNRPRSLSIVSSGECVEEAVL